MQNQEMYSTIYVSFVNVENKNIHLLIPELLIFDLEVIVKPSQVQHKRRG